MALKTPKADINPGPGAYDHSRSATRTQAQTYSFSRNKEPKLKAMQSTGDNPGPGQYEPRESFKMASPAPQKTLQDDRAYSFGKRSGVKKSKVGGSG